MTKAHNKKSIKNENKTIHNINNQCINNTKTILNHLKSIGNNYAKMPYSQCYLSKTIVNVQCQHFLKSMSYLSFQCQRGLSVLKGPLTAMLVHPRASAAPWRHLFRSWGSRETTLFCHTASIRSHTNVAHLFSGGFHTALNPGLLSF